MPTLHFVPRRQRLRDVAVARWRAGLYQAAHEACLQWQACAPDDFDAAVLTAWCAMALERDDAGAAFERVAALARVLAPQADRFIDTGRLALRRGRSEEALDWFREAMSCDSQHADACMHAGPLLRRAGRLGEAEAAYRRALALAPSAVAHANLAAVLAQGQRWHSALEHLEQAVALAPHFAEARRSLAQVRRFLASGQAGPPK